jgi:hypothetical protein
MNIESIFDIGRIRAAANKDDVFVAVTINQETWAVREAFLTKLYVFQTNSRGKLIGAISSEEMKKGTNEHSLRIETPVWNGRYWLIPATNHVYKKEYIVGHFTGWFYRAQYSAATIVRVSRRSDDTYKIKVKDITVSSPYTEGGIMDVRFLVSSADALAMPAGIPSLPLLVKDITYDDSSKHELEQHSTAWKLAWVNKRGKRDGALKDLAVATWQHPVPIEDELSPTGQVDFIRVIASGNPGATTMVQARSITLFKWIHTDTNSKRYYEYQVQLDLYDLDLATGKLRHRATNIPGKTGEALEPLLIAFDDSSRLLTRIIHRSHNGIDWTITMYSYLTSFSR